MARLTKRFVDTVRPAPSGREVTHWDDTLTGFGLRVQPGGTASYVIMYRTHNGRLRKMTLGRVGKLTPDEARAEARQKLAEVDRGQDPAGEKTAERRALTVGELCDWYLHEAAGQIKPNTLLMDRSRIECHIKPLIGDLTVSNLTTADITRMQADIASGVTAKGKRKGRGGNARGGRGVAARTVGMLGTIIEYAKRAGFMKENPARTVQKFPTQKRTRFLSPDEMRSLGKAMREFREQGENRVGIAAIRALLLTGCRRNEILTLPWSWIDARLRCLRFGDTKTGAQIRPIGKVALDHLTMQERKKDCPWVFSADSGEGHFVGLPRVFARLCRRCGFTDVTLHTLRHSFATTAAELGFSELTIAGLLGHSLSGVTARYAHMPDTALLSAADRVSARIAAALDGEQEAEIVPFAAPQSMRATAVD